MHFVQYSVVNDFFTFRLIAPSVTSEEIRFDITFIPGQGSVQLINRTVVVNEGGTQKVLHFNNNGIQEQFLKNASRIENIT